MCSKTLLLVILISTIGTQLASLQENETITEITTENTTEIAIEGSTEIPTEDSTESVIAATIKPCPCNKSEDESENSEETQETGKSVTLRDLADKLLEIEVLVAENGMLISKLKRIAVPEDNYPQHCLALKEQGFNISNVYFIKPKFAPEPFLVYCDMDTRGGGWTVILNRVDGTLNFDLDWKNYKNGFGQLRHEFWLGLEKIHYLTGFEMNELLIEVNEWVPKQAYFSSFSIGNEDEDFSIKLLDGYEGDAGNNMYESYGAKFSTKDKSVDPFNMKCAILSGGGWWHKNCGSTILTSKWTVYNVMSWQNSKMMVRPWFNTVKK